MSKIRFFGLYVHADTIAASVAVKFTLLLIIASHP
jgi:hypothetical protein